MYMYLSDRLILVRSCMLHCIFPYAGNGQIDFPEFVRMVEMRAERKPENAELRALFNAFDKDNSGYIDKTEIRDTLTAVGMKVRVRTCTRT